MVLTILLIYFLSFTDKPIMGVPALGERALELRSRYHIPIDSLDYPVSSQYVDSVTRIGCRVHHTTRWLNGATVEIPAADTAAVLPMLRACSFVEQVQLTRGDYPVKPSSLPAKAHAVPSPEDSVVYGASLQQLIHYNLLPLHHAGYKGQGVRVAVIDGGFMNVDTIGDLRDKVLGAYDCTDDTTSLYSKDGAHGLSCLSIIAGAKPGYMGAASEAEFVVIRSEEVATESLKEVDNLVAAFELADSLGAQIASVSLGYSLFDDSTMNFTQADMTGLVSRCSRAATIAGRKGMLVCAAAGNDRQKAWGTIASPADADSILTVGAVRYDSVFASFSSYGPSADGRVKPEVCAVGQQVYNYKEGGDVSSGNGTSFATPLIAGLAASLWSAFPHENAMQIRERILRSAHQYTTPDGDYGYGIPNAWAAYQNSPTQDIEIKNNCPSMAMKRLVNGQLMIQRDGMFYTILGQRY